ncbi:MAG: hypothetical protein R3A79_18905 [Nannocystaceae bacterium]
MSDNTNQEGATPQTGQTKHTEGLTTALEELIENIRLPLNDTLQKLKREAVQNVEQVHRRISDAEERARIAEENLDAALHLQNSKYQELIKAIFESPKTELKNAISQQSRKANWVTSIVAIFSIIASLAISAASSCEWNQRASKLAEGINSLSGTVTDLQREIALYNSLQETNASASSAAIGSIPVLVAEFVSASADSARSAVRLELVERDQQYNVALSAARALSPDKEMSIERSQQYFAMRLTTSVLADVDYPLILKAMADAGFPQQAIPTSPGDLYNWDRSFSTLCRRAMAKLSEMNLDDAPTAKDRRFSTYELADEPKFGTWQITGSITRRELLAEFKRRADNAESRMAYNASSNPILDRG